MVVREFFFAGEGENGDCVFEGFNRMFGKVVWSNFKMVYYSCNDVNIRWVFKFFNNNNIILYCIMIYVYRFIKWVCIILVLVIIFILGGINNMIWLLLDWKFGCFFFEGAGVGGSSGNLFGV